MTDLVDPPETGMQDASSHASTLRDPPPEVQLTSASASTSAPLPPDPVHQSRDSQDSSLSLSSRPTTLHLSTSDISSGNHPAPQHDDSTPPSSAISSQHNSQGRESPALLDRKQDVGQNDEREGSLEQRAGSTSESPRPSSISGTKRTASGQVKRASMNGAGDAGSATNGVGRSRTSSMVSNGTNGNVLELSQQLRTKLKYAMVKVQNGWQSRSLDEVESLASQSPRSTVSGFHRLNDQHMLSPRTVMSRKYQRESSDSDSSDSTVALENRGLVNMLGSPRVPARRSLAPPVDIMPGSRRRPTPNGVHQSINGAQVQSRQLHSARPPTSQRTPSQNAAMEADAVETLLFMASPNNSGYNPPSHASQDSSLRSALVFASQTSPLRTQFSQASMTSPKKVAFSNHEASGPSLDKADLIDRMLDELSDDSNDELEQAFRLAEKPETAATISI